MQTCTVTNGSGVFTTRNITNVLVTCETEDYACISVYDPVCAIVTTPIVCVTTPCILPKEYTTFGNACEASLEKAAVVLDHDCGNLEGAQHLDLDTV